MKLVNALKNIAAGAAAGVVVITALPILGPVGAITSTGIAIGAAGGAVLGAIDSFQEEEA